MSRHQDSNSNDRKLRPIFDCLDNGCYKKALQEIDKLLKKNKDSQYVRVLKSLTLIRMSRKKDAMELLSEVHNEMPCEDSVLQTMSMCYREIQRNDLIVSIYENALKKDPTNEKLHTHLFMAYVRLQDYKKQQLTALNLYKVHPKNPYYFWAVMSIYMQAITVEDPIIASKIILPLAEKMCEKFYKENKFETNVEYELYLMILDKQKRFAQMIELMDGLEAKKQVNDYFNFQLHRKVELLREENRLSKAFECLKKLIHMNNDQYNYYIEAFEVATLLDSNKKNSETNQNNQQNSLSYIIELLEILKQMCSTAKTTVWNLPNEKNNNNEQDSLHETVSKRCPRGPFIARIVIYNRIIKGKFLKNGEFGDLEKYFSENPFNLNDLLLDYYTLFGTKFVCIKDMIYILQNIELTTEQIQDLLMKIKFLLSSLEEPKQDINRSLCYHYLEYYNQQNFPENINNRLSVAVILFELYKRNKNSNVIKEDQQPFDPFIYLIIISIFADSDIYQNMDPSLSSCLFDMIVFLECYLAMNKTDFYTKLILICLYNATGAALSSHALYESLEIKLIQNDTLGYYFLPSFMHCALYSQAQSFLNLSFRFYTFNFKEASDYIISGYKNGSFSKIEEIIKFNQKLRNSIQYYSSFIEKFYIELLIDCKNETSFCNLADDCMVNVLNGSFDVDWQKIYDSRDIQILNSNHHRLDRYIMDTIKSKTLSQETQWLRFRFVLLKILFVGNYLSKKLFVDENANYSDINNGNDINCHPSFSSPDYEKHVSMETFEILVKDLNQLVESCQTEIIKEKLKYCLESPPPSRLNTFFSGKFSHLILLLLDYLLDLFRFISNQQQKLYSVENCNESRNIFDEISKEIESLNQLKLDTSLKGIYKIFGKLSTMVEVLSICVTLYGLLESTIRKLSRSIKRSKKKNTHHFKGSELFMTKFNTNLTLAQNNLDNYFKILLNDDLFSESFRFIDSLECKFSFKFENHETIVDMVRSNLKSSYNKSLCELNNVIQIKHKYLLSLNA